MSTSYERKVILALYEAGDWFDLFDLHKTLLLSPAQIVSVFMFLETEGYCETEGTKAKLTEDGIRWVLRNRRRIFMGGQRKWALPSGSTMDRRAPREPYMPRLKSVDKDFFRNIG